MSWKIQYTEEALNDIYNIYFHCAFVLKEKETAIKLVNKIRTEISHLDTMPYIFKLYDHEPWKSMGLRVMPVKKYLVFYTVDDTEQKIRIMHIFYGMRDINRCLEDIQ